VSNIADSGWDEIKKISKSRRNSRTNMRFNIKKLEENIAFFPSDLQKDLKDFLLKIKV
jgi:hypothetical protein